MSNKLAQYESWIDKHPPLTLHSSAFVVSESLRALYCVVTVFLSLFVCTASNGTTVFVHTVDNLVALSGLIVEGQVYSKRIDHGDETTLDVTIYLVCDIEIIVGEHSENCIDISVPGNDESGYLGIPRLEVGSKYVLFLSRSQMHTSPFVGWWQGVYKVLQDGNRASVVTSAGSPIRSISSNGYIHAERNVVYIEEGNNVLEAEIYSSSNTSNIPISDIIDRTMSLDDFKIEIHKGATRVLWNGLELPSTLPQQWTCRRTKYPQVVEPPLIFNIEGNNP